LEEIEKGNIKNLTEAINKYKNSFSKYITYYRTKFYSSTDLWLKVSDSYLLSSDRKEKIEKLTEQND
jgi:hypothetical protein